MWLAVLRTETASAKALMKEKSKQQFAKKKSYRSCAVALRQKSPTFVVRWAGRRDGTDGNTQRVPAETLRRDSWIRLIDGGLCVVWRLEEVEEEAKRWTISSSRPHVLILYVG